MGNHLKGISDENLLAAEADILAQAGILAGEYFTKNVDLREKLAGLHEAYLLDFLRENEGP